MPELLSGKAAVAVIRSLLMTRDDPPYDVIKKIIKNTGSGAHTVSAVIKLSLDKWRSKLSIFPDTDALKLAMELLEAIELSDKQLPRRSLIEEVSLEMAKAGFIRNFPEFPWRYLDREPSEDEIRGLVTAYIETGMKLKEGKYLKDMARKYLPKEKADIEVGRIQEFDKVRKTPVEEVFGD